MKDETNQEFKVEDRICFEEKKEGFPIFSIREVKLNSDDEPIEISDIGISLEGNSLDEIRKDLDHLKDIVDKPIINLNEFFRNH